MKDPARAQALKNINSDPQIKKILAEKPQVIRIVEEARSYKPVYGYNRISLYYHLKAQILQILPEPDAGKIYGLIGDLLPMDASDKESDEPCISGTF